MSAKTSYDICASRGNISSVDHDFKQKPTGLASNLNSKSLPQVPKNAHRPFFHQNNKILLRKERESTEDQKLDD